MPPALPGENVTLRDDPLGAVTFEMLVQTRRLAEAIGRLGVTHSHEAQVLARAMLETWVNARWIRLREPQLRALRFMKYEAVGGVRLLERVPEHDRTAENVARLARWKRDRARVRAIFRRGGKWSKTWAVTHIRGKRVLRGSVEARLQDIAKALDKPDGEQLIDSRERTTLYFIYAVLSQGGHGTQIGLSRLISRNPRYLAAADQPAVIPLLPMAQASSALAAHLGWATESFGAAYGAEAQSYGEAHQRLAARHWS